MSASGDIDVCFIDCGSSQGPPFALRLHATSLSAFKSTPTIGHSFAFAQKFPAFPKLFPLLRKMSIPSYAGRVHFIFISFCDRPLLLQLSFSLFLPLSLSPSHTLFLLVYVSVSPHVNFVLYMWMRFSPISFRPFYTFCCVFWLASGVPCALLFWGGFVSAIGASACSTCLCQPSKTNKGDSFL